MVGATELPDPDARPERLQELARIALDEMSPWIGVLDTDGTLLEHSRAAIEAGGQARADARAKPLWEALGWARTPKAQADLRAAIVRAAGGEAIRYDVEVRARADGDETRIVTVSVRPVRDGDGRVSVLLYEGRDVTEQRALERELARKDLELLRLREAAESASRAKDELLAILGHELRNPLAPIVTALQLIKLRGAEGAERARGVIERQVSHLVRLVDDLLDVSRIVRGKTELKHELVELADVVGNALELASPLFEQRRHTVTVDVPRRGLRVLGDEMRLGQVVSNLLTNAAKYTPAGGRVTVRAEREGGEVVLRVRDTGTGIPPEILPYVFDLFVQERQPLDRSQGGLGLGLTIVRSLVERHGGSVSAHSEGPGRGSELVVRLPEAVRPAGSDSAAPVVLVPRRAGAARILVVDDNADAAFTLAELLTEKGYDTRVAHDAPAALRVAAQHAPNLAVLDIGLPVMDGYELAVHLRGLPGLAGIRLIALSGYGQESDRQQATRAGFHHHLVKPVGIDAIEAAVQAALPSRDPNPPESSPPEQ